MTLSPQPPDYSIVVPVYDSGPRLRELVDRLTRVFVDSVGASYEIILVDDGSTNPVTRSLLPQLAELPNVLVVRLTKNFGKAGAVMGGLSQSRGQWIVTIDDDLQQLPEDIPKLIALRAHDMVTARHRKRKHSWSRELTSRIKQRFDSTVLGYTVPLSALKLINRRVVDGMLARAADQPFIPALIIEVTSDIVAVETSHHKSAYPASRYTFRARWRQFNNLLYGNSGFMMRVAAWSGMVLILLALAAVPALLAARLAGAVGDITTGFILVAIFLVGGANLAAIGISGEYLVRILGVSSKRPAFVIRERLGEPADGTSGEASNSRNSR